MKPILSFQITGVQLQTWGVFFALAAFLSFFVLIIIAKKKKISLDLIYNIYFLGFFAGIIGARVFYYLVHPQYFSFKEIFYFWQGGYVFFGSAFLGLLAIIIFLFLKKEKILPILNLIVVPLLLALVIMRLGSFLVLDNIGKTTTLPWAIEFLGEKRHPVDLYFIILDLLLLFFAFYLSRIKKDRKLFFWIVLFLAIGRLIIHHFSTFATLWDANCNILFWALALFVSLVSLGWLMKKTPKNYQT